MSEATSTVQTCYKKIIKVSDLPRLSEAKNQTRAMMINCILDLLMPATGRTAWKTTNAKLIKRLTSTPDLTYLQRVLDLAVIAGDNEKYSRRNRDFIITEASGGLRYDLNTVHANREWLPQHNNDMQHFSFVLGQLRLDYKSTERIPTLASHLLAYKNYGHVREDGMALFGLHGYGNTQLCKIIEKRPSMVKLILDYRDMIGTNDISETDFRVFAAKHTEFTPAQQQAIWQTRSNRAYKDGTLIHRAFGNPVISRSEWETVQDREEVMTLR